MTGQSAYEMQGQLELQATVGQQHSQIQQHLQDALMTQTIRAMMGGAVPPPTRQPPTQNIRPVSYHPIPNPIPSPGIQQFSMAQLQQINPSLSNSLYMSNLAMGQHQPANQQQRSRPRQRKASKNSLDKVEKNSRKKNPKNSLGYKLAKLSLSEIATSVSSSRPSVSSTHASVSSTHTSVSQSPTPINPIIPSSTQTTVPQTAPTVNPHYPLATHASVASLQNPYTIATHAYLQQRQLFLQSLLPKYNPFRSVLNPLAHASCPNVAPTTSKFTLPLTNNKFKP